LTDDELFALWRATKRLPYPAGPVYQLLALTALRLNEVAGAAWPEFNLADRLWIIPAERMKGREETAQPHAVPLTDDMLAILAALPRFKKGKHVFSLTFGEQQAWIGDKIKKDIDARIARTLKAMARKRGDDPTDVELKPWVNHDIRRTVRSHLSRLKVTEEAREAVMAHVRPGIKGVYDLYDYLDEKRDALTLWAARLRSIVKPAPGNVIKMYVTA
jgi:integrase